MNPLALRERDLAILRDTFDRFSIVREVWVFGSRTTVHAPRASDLDLAISAPEATPSEWADLREALENAPLIYELDLVRMEQITNTQLKEKIIQEGRSIYAS